ncbi:MAG: DUF4382 domain-containing protein [Bacteroidota bacterium]
MNTRFIISIVAILTAAAIIISACKKKEDEPDPVVKGTVKMGISDAKDPYSSKQLNDNIVSSADLTKCQITISSIQLKGSDGNYTSILSGPTSVDLRQFQGTVKDLLSVNIPVGSYSAIKVSVSGVSTTYQGNNYTASTTASATVTLSNVPGVTLTEANGVVNAFSGGAISFELPLQFTISDASDVENIRLFFDAEASTYVVSFTYQSNTWNFAGIRAWPNVSIILEEGIQQIRHSPPLGITIVSASDVDYYGIHTFVDFNQKGGTINSHTSQHVYRGEDGSLLVDAETMTANTNPLVPNTVAATGESDIRSDETFHYSAILSNLAGQGYNLQSGQTYYFSLRKTWNITTDGNTYDLTRICEPIPIVMP